MPEILRDKRRTHQSLMAMCCVLFAMSLGNPDARAQPVSLGDSLAILLKVPASPFVRMDTRNSFITGRNACIFGVKAGISYGNRLAFGIGYNWLENDFTRNIEVQVEGELVTTEADLRLHFVSPFAEYAFYSRKGVAISIPVQIGMGVSRLVFREPDGSRRSVREGFALLYEPAMTIEKQFLKYFAVGGGIGFRLMLVRNPAIHEQFSSPIYLLRFRLLFRELYKDFQSGRSL